MSLHDESNLGSPFDDGNVYDLLFSNFDYGLEYYLQLAQAAEGPVLDIACGTGRVMLPCLEAGLDVDGLDLSTALLDRLREKAAIKGLNPTLFEGDMRNFRLDRRYRLAIIPFNAFVHCMNGEEQIAALRCIREHLEPGGMLAFDTFFPGFEMINLPNQTRVLEMETDHPTPGWKVRVYDTRTLNRIDQIQHSFMEIEELNDAGEVVKVHPSQTQIRWIYKQEMELLLRLSGFWNWNIWGSFERRPLVNETDAMIVEATV